MEWKYTNRINKLEKEKQYLNLKEELENFLQNKNEIREILDKVIAYKQLMLTETSILNERYYRMKFKNGMCLLIECLKYITIIVF